jgi:hypothetical protein
MLIDLALLSLLENRDHQVVRVGEVSALKGRPNCRNKGSWVTHGQG